MDNSFFISSQCTRCDHRKLLVLREKKCQIVFQNPEEKKLCNTRIDNCLIKSGLRCDYLVIIPEEKNSFFVELKGQDLLDAIRQITASIEILNPHLTDSIINARIVLTKVNTPDLMNNPKILRFEKMIRNYKGTLIKGTIKMIEKI